MNLRSVHRTHTLHVELLLFALIGFEPVQHRGDCLNSECAGLCQEAGQWAVMELFVLFVLQHWSPCDWLCTCVHTYIRRVPTVHTYLLAYSLKDK